MLEKMLERFASHKSYLKAWRYKIINNTKKRHEGLLKKLLKAFNILKIKEQEHLKWIVK